MPRKVPLSLLNELLICTKWVSRPAAANSRSQNARAKAAIVLALVELDDKGPIERGRDKPHRFPYLRPSPPPARRESGGPARDAAGAGPRPVAAMVEGAADCV